MRFRRAGGRFLMMDHEVPSRLLIRILFYVHRHFAAVERIETDTGESKILRGRTATTDAHRRTHAGFV